MLTEINVPFKRDSGIALSVKLVIHSISSNNWPLVSFQLYDFQEYYRHVQFHEEKSQNVLVHEYLWQLLIDTFRHFPNSGIRKLLCREHVKCSSKSHHKFSAIAAECHQIESHLEKA